MINVVGSTPTPASPLPPDLPGELPTDPTQTAPVVSPMETVTPTDSGASSPANTQPPQKKSKISAKYLVAGLVLLLLAIGSGIGMYLIKLNQDLRQQAGGSCGGVYLSCSPPMECDPAQGKCVLPAGKCLTNANCSAGLTCQNNECKPPLVIAPPSGNCSGASATKCVGHPEGYICDNNPPGSGVCVMLSGGACTCRRSDVTSPTAAPTTKTPTTSCTQIAGQCLNSSGDCISYTDGCQQTANCASPIQECPTPTTSPTPTPTPTESATPTPTATPTTIASANSSATANTTVTGSTTGATTNGQPNLPSTLPQTGPEDWLKYLQIGLGVLGSGALLLLFL